MSSCVTAVCLLARHSPLSLVHPSLTLSSTGLSLFSFVSLSGRHCAWACIRVCVCAFVCEKAIHLPPPYTFHNYNRLVFPPCQVMLCSLLCAAVCLSVGTYCMCEMHECVYSMCISYTVAKHRHPSSLVITLYISCHLLWVETRDFGRERTRTHNECRYISCILNKAFPLHV